ncbi:DNA mismatch repair protein MutT [Streptomyces sp. WAC 06725]|uniref:GNAT family N-acetyltransferase n=1 Tax=Streptomyces sp. WAC 06725 TaxID=2203209 RepID=UPI000F74B12E|nr:GNAT family N-acetyltransferase [Streptomyces sp. WAC 06725]RSO30369.1 DNA mismatch repair protein MutT [Streptomyces sp. WAC 06725]
MSSRPTTIRPYRPEDEQAVTGFRPRTVRPSAEPDTWVAVDEPDGKVVGLLHLPGSEISDLYVAPEVRGRGIGTQLVEHAASLRGALSLEVSARNTAARAFYTHLGFTERSHRTDKSTGETLVALDRPAPLRSVSWLHVRDGRLLSVRTRGNDTFYLPGGKYEPGETAPEALSRELSEELGLSIPADELRQAFVIHATAHGVNAGRRLHMTCFTGGPQDVDPAPGREIAEYAWFDRHEARDRCAPAHMQVVNRLIAEGRMAA